jgi:hypothetical protein
MVLWHLVMADTQLFVGQYVRTDDHAGVRRPERVLGRQLRVLRPQRRNHISRTGRIRHTGTPSEPAFRKRHNTESRPAKYPAGA